MHIQDPQWAMTATVSGHPDTVVRGVGGSRTSPLRVDAQRNLEHVLRAAREVFGELGYGAPMEDVARRARVGVGTVYRRFPSKDVLVRRIAEEETARLTEQARAALGQEEEAWSALSRFLRTSVASGAGRLLPPQVLHVQPAGAPDGARVPQQRGAGRTSPRAPVSPRCWTSSGSWWSGRGRPVNCARTCRWPTCCWSSPPRRRHCRTRPNRRPPRAGCWTSCWKGCGPVRGREADPFR